MEAPQSSSTSTSAQVAKQPSQAQSSQMEFEPHAVPLTESEFVESRRQLEKLHPGNRFRLMFGQALLPGKPLSGTSRSSP